MWFHKGTTKRIASTSFTEVFFMPEISSVLIFTGIGSLPLQSPYLHPSQQQAMIIFPRLEKLSEFVDSLPVDREYRARLYRSIAINAGQILARPDPPPEME
jgi:hypothetical protein